MGSGYCCSPREIIMNFKYRKLASALALLVTTTSIASEAEHHEYQLGAYADDNSTTIPFRSSANKDGQYFVFSSTDLHKSSGFASYFVILEDEPVASYGGGIDGVAATSLFASKNSNSTGNGKLNTKSLASKQYTSYLAGKQSEHQLHASLKLKRPIETLTSYQVVLNGYATQLSPSEAILVSQLPGVKAVTPSGVSYLESDSGPGFIGATKAWQGTLNYEGSKGEGMILGVIDSGIASFLEPVLDKSSLTTLEGLPPFNPSFADIGGDGYDHENPRATDPNAESLYVGDCVDQPGWCNDKLIGVWAFGSLATDIVNRSTSDARSETGQDTHGHGTHVASTAAGNVVKNVQTQGEIGGPLTDIYPHSFVYPEMSGVAPHANIISYQTCDKSGSCDNFLAIAAIEQAVKDGVDVINYSVGGAAALPWYHWVSLAYLNAREAGVHVATSAGNNGNFGKQTVKSPGNAPWIVSVAASSHDRGFNAKTATLSGGSSSFELESATLIGKSATAGIDATEIVYAADVEYSQTGKHTHTHSHDAQHQYQYLHVEGDHPEIDLNSTEYFEYSARGEYLHTHEHDHEDAEERFDLAGACGADSIPAEKIVGKIVICNRGGVSVDGSLSRASKSAALKELGAAGMILINTDDSAENIEHDLHSIPSVHLKKKDGKELLAWLAEGENHKVAISDSELVSSLERQHYENHEDFSGLMGSFSSQGPDVFTGDYLIPQITAPGVSILASGLGDNMQDISTHPMLLTNTDQKYNTGTSMASPHVAGALLLLKSAQPTWTPSQAQSALMLTADTGLRYLDKIVLKKQTFKAAELHSTGAGLVRIEKAIETGLLMSVSKSEYLNADPYGDIASIRMPLYPEEWQTPSYEEVENIRELEKDVPTDWHGKPGKMNLPSLSKGQCIDACSWTRTFEAIKSAIWTVSYSYTTKGMTLTSEIVNVKRGGEFTGEVVTGDSIAVSPGDSFSINVTATVNDELDSVWSDGRVHLTPSNTDIPNVSLPVTVEFVAGKLPENVEVTAHRNIGTADVKGVVTIGSEELSLTASSLSKGVVYTKQIKRAKTPNQAAEELDTASAAISISIPAGAERLYVEVLSSTSPDVDVYMGLDSDLNGLPNAAELNSIPYFGITSSRYEIINEINPSSGEYWIMIHNYGDQFNDSERDEYIPENSEIIDEITIIVSVVADDWNKDEDDVDELKLTAVKDNFADSTVPVQLAWNKEMQTGDRYYGVLGFGSNDDLPFNIGIISVDINRGIDDVRLQTLATDANDAAASRAGFTLTFAENNGSEDLVYSMTAELVSGSSLISFDALDYTIENDLITWQYTQAVGASAQTFTLLVDYLMVGGITDITPLVTSQLADEETAQIASNPNPVMIHGSPVVEVEATSLFAKPGETITLTSYIVDAVIEQPEFTYQWTQLTGQPVSFITTAESISFVIPDNENEEISFELVANNGARDSQPVITSIYIDAQETSSGGSTPFSFILFGLALLFARKKLSIH